MELMGEFMKKLKEPLTNSIKSVLVPRFAGMLNHDEPIQAEIIDGYCFFIDVMEHLDQSLFNEIYLDIYKQMVDVFDDN